MDIKRPAIAGIIGLLFATAPAFAAPDAEDCGPAELAELSDSGADDSSIPVAETFAVSGSCDAGGEAPASPFGFTKSSGIPAAPTPVQPEPTPEPAPEVVETPVETRVEVVDEFAGAIEVGTISADPDPEPIVREPVRRPVVRAPVVRRPAPRPAAVKPRPRPRYVRPAPRPRVVKPRKVTPVKTAQRRLTTRRYRANPPIIDRECKYSGGCRHEPIVVMVAAPLESVKPKYRTKAGERLTLTDTEHRTNPPIRDMSCPTTRKTFVIMRAE